MEELKSNTNSVMIYPDKKVMELFLAVGKKANMFTTTMINVDAWIHEKRYLSGNDIRCLAIISEYMSLVDHEKEMREFMEIVNTQGIGNVYVFIARWVMKIRWEKKQNEYTKQTIALYQNKLWDKTEISSDEMPIVPQSILPNWRKENRGWFLIHEAFQERMVYENGISQKADNIQKQSNDHMFSRGDVSDQIDDLKNKL